MKRIACSGCSLLCDDILVSTDGIFIDKIVGACLKGKERFEQVNAKNRVLHPMIRHDNELSKCSWDEALTKTAEILKNSSKPLLYGFSTISCEAQLEGLKLAEQLNGFIDSNSSICMGKVLNIAKDTGITLTTISEVVNKSDLIMIWGANVAESIPRLLNKILFSRGEILSIISSKHNPQSIIT